MTDIRDLLGEGFPAVELYKEVTKAAHALKSRERPYFVDKADAALRELLTALRGLQAEKMSLLAESMRREEDAADAIKRASARADYAEEIAQHNGWHLAYERAVREVVEAAYQHLKTEYLSSLIDDVHDRRLEQAEQTLAAAREEAERLKVCGNCRHCEAHGLFCVEATLLGYDGARDEGWPNWYKDGSFNVHVLLGDPCHFTPSRWTLTTEAPE